MEPEQNNNYWNAAGKAGAIFGGIVFLVSLIGSYITIHSEPTGSILSGTILTSAIGCLIGAFGGVLAIKMYINEYGTEMKIGKGAVIGLVTGIMMALIFQVLTLIWPMVDSSYIDNLQAAMIANLEMMEQIPEAQREEMIDAMYTQMQNYYSAANILQSLIMGFLSYGLLNLISGLLSAKIMGTPPKEF